MASRNKNPDEASASLSGSISPSSLSVPSALLYHAVEDGELERMMKLQSPGMANLAMAALGFLIGALPDTIETVQSVLVDKPIGVKSLAYAMVSAASLVTVAIAGTMAFRGKSEAVRILEAIRDRPKIPGPVAHLAAHSAPQARPRAREG